MKILMTVMSDVVHDARVSREARTLSEAGHEVTIVGLEPVSAAALPGDLDIRWAQGSSPFPRGHASSRRSRARQAARWLLLPTHVNRLTTSFHRSVRELVEGIEFDVVHAHDFDTLELGAALADEAGVPFIYDTHECWLGRKRHGRPTPLEDRRTARREAELGSRAHAVITVGEGLADWLHNRYGWDHVTVVRNTFPALRTAEPVVPEPHALLYAGRIGRGRDLEPLVEAAPHLPLPVTLLGPQDAQYVSRIGSAVEVRSPVPVDDVDIEYQRAGVGLVLVADGPINHRVALPNKLFQAVRAGVPVVSTDLPELRKVVGAYGLGTLYRPGDPRSLRAAVDQLLVDYEVFRAAVLAAQPELSWQVDARRLIDIYESPALCA